MTVKELAEECKNHVSCFSCPYYEKECKKFEKLIHELSPESTSPIKFMQILEQEV